MHLQPGGLRHGLHLLRHRAAGFQPQSKCPPEIVGQVWLAQRELALDAPRKIESAAGQSAAQYPASATSRMWYSWAWASRWRIIATCCRRLRIFMDDLGYDLSRRRVTLSTSGLVPQIYKLAEECNVSHWLFRCTRRMMSCATS